MRKSRFLTFFLGMIPGAGQMYLGYMKRGVSLMTMFFMCIAISGILNISFLVVGLPIIWFYAFFDAMNLRALTYDERFRPMDDYIFHLRDLEKYDVFRFLQKRRMVVGVVCILLGVYFILQNIVAPFFYSIGIDFFNFFRNIPMLAVSIAIIWFGISLVKSDKFVGYLEDEFQDYNDKGNH